MDTRDTVIWKDSVDCAIIHFGVLNRHFTEGPRALHIVSLHIDAVGDMFGGGLQKLCRRVKPGLPFRVDFTVDVDENGEPF